MHDFGGFPVGHRNHTHGFRSPRLLPDMPHLPIVGAHGRIAPGFIKDPLTEGVNIQTNSAHSPPPRAGGHYRCSLNGTGVIAATAAGVLTSTMVTHDFGRTWNDVPSGSQEQNSVATDGAGVWMVNSSNSVSGSQTLWSFNDGQQWTQRAGPFTGFQYAAGYNNGRFFVGQYSSTQMYWTENYGVTWVQAVLPNSQHMRAYAGDGQSTVIVGGENTSTLHYSKDNGATWRAGGTGLFTSTQLLFALGKFWWPCGANQFIEYTEDCINIKRAYLPTTSGTWVSMGWSPAGYFILSGNIDGRMLMSRDGLTWALLPTLRGDSNNIMWQGTPFGFSGMGHATTRPVLIDLT